MEKNKLKVNKNKKKNSKKKESKDKRLLVTLIIGVSFLLILVIGATYAYFSVETSLVTGTTTINANAETIGTVSLVGTSATFNLNLTALNMMQGASDTTYWATTTGTPTTTESTVTVGTTSVSPTTDTHHYDCDYTIEISDVTSNGVTNMYTLFQSAAYSSYKSTNQIVLTVGGTTYDFNTANLFSSTIEVQGTLSDVTYSTPRSITSSFKVVNKSNIDQTLLAGTGISLEIEVTDFSCTVVQPNNI